MKTHLILSSAKCCYFVSYANQVIPVCSDDRATNVVQCWLKSLTRFLQSSSCFFCVTCLVPMTSYKISNFLLPHSFSHDGFIKWKPFPRYWPFVRGFHRSPVFSPHKGQWHRALMFSLIWAWINDWENNHEAGDLRRHHTHYDVTVMHTISINPIECSGQMSSVYTSLIHLMKKIILKAQRCLNKMSDT